MTQPPDVRVADLRAGIVKLREQLARARLRGRFYSRAGLDGLVCDLAARRRQLVLEAAEIRIGEGSVLTWQRWRWLDLVYVRRAELREIAETLQAYARWLPRARHALARNRLMSNPLSAQRMTARGRRMLLTIMEGRQKNREELLARAQRFEEQPVPTYRAWASDPGTQGRARDAVLAMQGPQLDDGEAWLRRQLEGLGERRA